MAIIDRVARGVRLKRLQSAWDSARMHDWPDEIVAYLAAGPAVRGTVGDLSCLALDFETDGLDVASDRILSAGWLQCDARRISGVTAQHHLVRHQGADAERGAGAVAVHGLTDSRLAEGTPLESVVPAIFSALAGRAMLVHYAPVETGFLKAACQKLYGAAPPLVVIDTLQLEASRAGADRHTRTPGALRLVNLRRAYGLPDYANHHALSDAHACAELYLAQISSMQRRDQAALRILDAYY